MATPIIARPMTATMARDSMIGTGQPSQVMFGESRCSDGGPEHRFECYTDSHRDAYNPEHIWVSPALALQRCRT